MAEDFQMYLSSSALPIKLRLSTRQSRPDAQWMFQTNMVKAALYSPVFLPGLPIPPQPLTLGLLFPLSVIGLWYYHPHYA